MRATVCKAGWEGGELQGQNPRRPSTARAGQHPDQGQNQKEEKAKKVPRTPMGQKQFMCPPAQ